MNHLQLVVINGTDPTSIYRSVDILIDGKRFIDMLECIERPYAIEEGSPEIAGQYLSLPFHLTLLPSRHFFGDPAPYLSHNGKTVLLMCTCGCEGCWDFVCHITFSENTVTWSGFEQIHREWDYSELGILTFDRKNYEEQFSQLSKSTD